jgi:hypothetical protein
LNNGQTLSGDPISYNETGLIIRTSDGSVSTRTPWSQFTQDSLKQLLEEAKTPKDKAFVEPYIEEIVEKAAKRKEITIKPVEKPAMPTGDKGISAGFSSPVFLVIFLILYAANIYVGYEIAFFKNQPIALVCGVSAVAPWLGPLVFLCIPGRPDLMGSQSLINTAPAAAPQEAPVETIIEPAPLTPEEQAAEEQAAAAAAAPVLPAPIVFRRGEFSFNRRFFETKFAGFFRLVPGEAEKDMVLRVKSMRGDFIGKRISKVTQNELYLQVFKDNATHDEMIPFAEVQEVVIQHKDA